MQRTLACCHTRKKRTDQHHHVQILTWSQVSLFNQELCFYCQDIRHDKDHTSAGSPPQPVLLCRVWTSENHSQKSLLPVTVIYGNWIWQTSLQRMTSILGTSDTTKAVICSNGKSLCSSEKDSPSTKKNPSAEDAMAFILAEAEFIAELQEHLGDGDIIMLTKVATFYTVRLCVWFFFFTVMPVIINTTYPHIIWFLLLCIM